MKNIAIITPSLKNGGAERVAGLLSIKLTRHFNVFLFVHIADELIYDYSGTIIRIGDIQEKYQLSLCEAVKKAKIDNDIDVSISFLVAYNYANIWSRGKDRIIVSERNAQSQIRNRKRWMDKVTRDYYNYADAVVACSWGVKSVLVKDYEVKQDSIYTIYNYINQKDILTKATDHVDKGILEWLEGAEYFVNVGRLNPQKQQKRLIKQFEKFHKENGSGTKLIIIGSGELEGELKGIIKEDEMEEKILIVPFMSNPFPVIKNAKAVILSSHNEGLPNIILESMTIGKPIIATDCLAGPRELLNDETDYSESIEDNKECKRGLLVPNADTDDIGETFFLAKGMKQICRDNVMCDGFVNNQKLYMSQYRDDEITEKWIQLIENDERKQILLPELEDGLLSLAEHIYLYGAGKWGQRVYKRIKDRYNITAFIVSDNQNTSNYEAVIPIKHLGEVDVTDDKTVIVLGVSAAYADEIIDQLEARAVKNLVILGECW